MVVEAVQVTSKHFVVNEFSLCDERFRPLQWTLCM